MALDVDFYERIARLGRAGESFAVATVVGRRAPVSAHLGDHAIIFADGRMEGFVGGACAHEIVRTQGLEVLALGQSRIVSIQPDAGGTEAGSDRVVVPMTCASEGAVDIYIEPVVPARLLVVVGATPIAGALARLARSLDFRVVRVVDGRERADIEPDAARFGFAIAELDALGDLLTQTGAGPDGRAVVVASQGHYDEEAIAAALNGGVPYVGLVASRTRGASVKTLLEKQGVPGVAALHNPAGLDLGGRTGPEVALSILAEIVQSTCRRERGVPARQEAVAAAPPSTAADPVCHMQVDIPTVRHQADVDGVTYYFCSASCKARFVKQPQDYLSRTP